LRLAETANLILVDDGGNDLQVAMLGQAPPWRAGFVEVNKPGHSHTLRAATAALQRYATADATSLGRG
jgi:hypothetical protein